MSGPDDEKTTLRPPGEDPSDDERTISVERESVSDDLGRRIGHYTLKRELGRGGQGAVYLAYDERLKRPVALKVMSAQLGYSEQARLRFRREAEVASRLDHPGICTVYDAGEFEGVPFIAMRYIDGSALDVLIRRARRGDGDDALTELSGAGGEATRSGDEIRGKLLFFEKVLRALHAAHEAGLVHRDVKPGNIMVTREGEPVILDFGLARIEEAEGPLLTMSSDHVGTPAYMSPEQVGGASHDLDARSDIYSAAVALYELLTLRRPHEAPTREALYRAILMNDPPDARTLEPRIPGDLAVVLDRALEKSPDRRYSTARALADDVLAVTEHRPVSVKPISTPERAWRWARRRPGVASLLVISIVALTSVVGLGLYTLGRSELVRRGEIETARENANRELEAAFLLQDAGDLEGALGRFDRAVVEGKPLPEAVAAQAILLLGEDACADAVSLLERNDDVVSEVPMLGGLKEYARARRDGLSERQALESMVLPEPRSPVEFFVLALSEESRAERGDGEAWGRATEYMVQAVLRAERSQPLQHFLLARFAGHAGDRQLVRHVGESIMGRWPESPAAAYWAGYGHNFAGDLDRAKRCFEHALTLDPAFARAHAGLAIVARRSGDVEVARAHLVEAMKDPRDVSSRMTMMDLLIAEKRPDEAAAVGRELVAFAPRDDDAWSLLARALWNVGDRTAAMEAQAEAVKLDPGYGPHALVLADMSLVVGREDEALRLAESVIAYDAPAVLTRVPGLVESGYAAHAADVLEALHRKMPALSDAQEYGRLYLVELHLRTGLAENVDEARRARHRKKARSICAELLDAWDEMVEGSAAERTTVRKALARVMASDLFEALDDERLLATFDEDERDAWDDLGDRVERLADRLD